ncbi:ankyrin-2 [Penicillium pulvis]|uniref:ankyrin-2 n=1 Tax=Penicillium pulvis TaxID=1562058 RepID=UPI00254887C0|nr:ankyrin-2 [Penicillium pulvis]KAJ5813289.1 ankyrin-2 [Penicillium pulvis]
MATGTSVTIVQTLSFKLIKTGYALSQWLWRFPHPTIISWKQTLVPDVLCMHWWATIDSKLTIGVVFYKEKNDRGLFPPSSNGYRHRWRKVRQKFPQGKYGEKVKYVWEVQSSTVPSRAALAQIFMDDLLLFHLCNRIAYPENSKWLGISNTAELDIQDFEKTHGMLCIMTKRRDLNASESR